MADPRIRLSGIYAIRNNASGRVYVGSGVRIERRWNNHRTLLRNGLHHSDTLQRSWNKHGEKAFSFEVLEVVEDVGRLIEREQHWIDTLHAACPKRGFNKCPTAGNCLGTKHSLETRAIMSAVSRASGKSAAFILAFWAEASPEYLAAHAAKISAKNKGRPNPRRHLTPDQVEQAKRLKDAGWTYVELSNYYGISGPTLFRAVKGQTYTIPLSDEVGQVGALPQLADPTNENLIAPGTRGRRTNQTQRKMTFEQAEQMRALRTQGWTYKRLEREFGLSRASAHDIVSGKTYARP